MRGELVAYRSLLAGNYSLADRRSAARSHEKRAPDYSLNTGASLIVTLLLSLGLWAGIWSAVASVFSAALG